MGMREDHVRYKAGCVVESWCGMGRMVIESYCILVLVYNCKVRCIARVFQLLTLDAWSHK